MKLELGDVVKFKLENGELGYGEISGFRVASTGKTYEIDTVIGDVHVDIADGDIVTRYVPFKPRIKKQ